MSLLHLVWFFSATMKYRKTRKAVVKGNGIRFWAIGIHIVIERKGFWQEAAGAALVERYSSNPVFA